VYINQYIPMEPERQTKKNPNKHANHRNKLWRNVNQQVQLFVTSPLRTYRDISSKAVLKTSA